MRSRAQPWSIALGALCAWAAALGGASYAAPDTPAPQAPRPAPPSPPIFTELSDSGIRFTHFNGMSGGWHMAEINSGGGALLDYDNDGDLDVYLVQGALLPPAKTLAEAVRPPTGDQPPADRLYRNDLEVLADGRRVLRFTDVTREARIDATGYGMGVAAGDFDNDGFVDLFVAQLGRNLLLRNRGDGTFEDRSAATGTDTGRWSVPALFADFDADGWLDLYVGNYLDSPLDIQKVCRTANGTRDYCGPSSYPGLPDRLLRNRGDGTFADVTVEAGLHRERSKSLGAVATDLDGDGRLDLYVTNDGTPNQMWLQGDEGRFSEEALFAGNAVNAKGEPEASMGVDAADVDGDGDDDLFMTHLTRETNTLYLNDGAGSFTDATIKSGLGPPSWSVTSWGTAFFDYDNDGALDLLVANGAVRVIESLATAGDPYPFHQPNQLFRNTGQGRFEDVMAIAGEVFGLSEVSRGVAFGDLDNDGDTDALLINNCGPARVLINQVGQSRHWLGLRLVGKDGRDRLGARVEVLRDGQPALWRRVRTDGSFAAANDPRVLAGLGPSSTPPTVRVTWPGGRREEWKGLPIDRYTTLTEGTGRSLP